MLNKVCIMGRLVRDPELRRTQSGYAVTTIRIAVDRDFRNKDGTRQADFFDVTAWQSTAEFISRYFTKGRMIIVDGRLQVREWTDREGNKRNNVDIVADSVYFGDSRRDNAPGGEYGSFGGASGSYGSGGGYGSSSGSYGSGSSGGYSSGGAAPGYDAAPSGGSGYGGNAPGYGGAPAQTSSPSEFADLGEDDGDLPF